MMPKVRPAVMADAVAITDLVNYYAERGRMLHRSLESVYDGLRDFLVCEKGGELIGCVALSMSGKGLGEIRSLAVSPACQGQGIGRLLMARALEDSRALGLTRVFALTYETAFFTKLGFHVLDKEFLPTKVWRDCIHCPRADACDEVAVACDL
jgi:amino-acid N-acetyltransferase